MPIALLKFPTDLLREVFQLCNPFELYKLSICSKRTQRCVMLGGRKNWKIRSNAVSSEVVHVDGFPRNFDKNEVLLYVDNLIYVFEKAAKPEDFFITQHFVGDRNFFRPDGRNLFRPEYVSIQCPDVDVELFGSLLVTFGIPIVDRLRIDFGSFESFSNIADILIGRNIEIKEFCVGETETRKVIDAVNYMSLINQMNITQKFECEQKFLRRHNYQLNKYPDTIIIKWSFWFNIGQLLNNNCVRLELEKSMLRNEELDGFLKEWKKAGTFPNLRWLQIDSMKIDKNYRILEIVPPIRNSGKTYIKIEFGWNNHMGILGPVRITKEEGTVGWLKVELGRSPNLKFLV
ncbi:hypothetical protein B9Z55_003687 [Caenorhabditis nigoni]|uniref:F-box domain-containing protein n=1 Tax=Caenorhabditis nigoni TaxID=1611254 RepID=A0A2G5VRI8_9PELO|nr:hypothetical protein B9Z55_003687 [Caenorhabditis nigoni]